MAADSPLDAEALAAVEEGDIVVVWGRTTTPGTVVYNGRPTDDDVVRVEIATHDHGGRGSERGADEPLRVVPSG